MQRRTLAFLLIGFGLVVIIGASLWILWPWLHPTSSTPSKPVLPLTTGQAQPTKLGTPIVQPTPAQTPAVKQSKLWEEQLRRTAQAFASRAGSYSNVDGFASLISSGFGASSSVQAYFVDQRAALNAAHPLQSGSWGQTARGLASRIVTSLPITSVQTSVQVQVDAQIITNAGSTQGATSYRQALVTFDRSGQDWIVSRISWQDQP